MSDVLLAPSHLPDQPDLRHLRGEARALRRAGSVSTLAEAQFAVAKRYGYASWPKLKTHVDSLHEAGRLKSAIDAEDWVQVRAMMTANRVLHKAPLGYRKSGPLTWLAECRIPWQAPTAGRLAMAEWMIANGSDIHQGGDGPLMRAALSDERIPMMELLVSRGADVNALWNGNYPIVLAPCETLASHSLAWLLDHGADPNTISPKYGEPLSMLTGTYSRNAEGKHACLQVLAEHGYPLPETAPMAVHAGSLALLEQQLARDAELLSRRYSASDIFLGSEPEKVFTWTPIEGTTVLHLGVEFDDALTAGWLIGRGADVNARAAIDAEGFGGQTPLFHAVIFGSGTEETVRLLLESGADPNLRATFRKRSTDSTNPDFDRTQEFRGVTALGYARAYPEQQWVNRKAVDFLISAGGIE